jgi:hypothetical protein
MSKNGIAWLPTKEERQLAKLQLAETKRQQTGTAGYRENRYLDLTLLPTVYSGDGIVNNPNVGGLQAGRPWKSTPNILAGLWRSVYSGYYGNNTILAEETDVQWFDTQTPIETQAVENFNYNISSGSGLSQSVQWLGYFRAPYTANYTFDATGSDDELYFWIGNKAITGYTAANADVYNYAGGSGSEVSDPVSLEEGEYYPIRMQWGNSTGGGEVVFGWSSDFDIITSGLVVQLVPADYATTPSPGTWVNRRDFPEWNAGTIDPNGPTYISVDVACFQYNGSGQFWNLEPNPTSGDFTASIWFLTSSTAGTGSYFYNNPALIGGDVGGLAYDWGMVIRNGCVGVGAVSGQTVFTPNQFNDGNWHCATVTRVQTTGVMKLYINGVLQTQMIEAPDTALTDSPKLYIGADPTNGQPYTGYIGEVDFWQIALTAEQLATNFEAQRSTYGV